MEIKDLKIETSKKVYGTTKMPYKRYSVSITETH